MKNIDMKFFAKFTTVNSPFGALTFRHSTYLKSPYGEKPIIGLVVMMNPGTAEPIENLSKNSLDEITSEIIPDPTLKIVRSFVKRAYKINQIKLPNEFSIQIENLFNLVEDDPKEAIKKTRLILEWDDSKVIELLIRKDSFQSNYQFVWFAWGEKANLFNKYH